METLRSSGAPAYQRIATTYRDKITSGKLRPGDRLPTENEIAERFGVARQTVRAGLGVLVGEGLIVARRPQGHFVRQREQMLYRPQEMSRSQPATQEMPHFVRQIVNEGRIPAYDVEVSLIQATPELADRLHLDQSDRLVARRRVRFINGEPINTNDSYFPYDLVKDSEIMSPVHIARGANRVMTDLGYPLDHAIDEICIRMPTPEELHRLSLGPGTPVAVHYDTGYTADGHPVHCTINILPGDRHRIVFERTWRHA